MGSDFSPLAATLALGLIQPQNLDKALQTSQEERGGGALHFPNYSFFSMSVVSKTGGFYFAELKWEMCFILVLSRFLFPDWKEGSLEQ